MTFRHLCFHLPTFPRRAPDAVVDQMLHVTRALGARATAIVAQIERPAPHPTLGRYLDLLQIVETQNRESLENMRHLRVYLVKRAEALQVGCEIDAVTAAMSDVPKLVIERMRASDLAITPFVGAPDGQPHFLEALVFEAGRPLLVLPRDLPSSASFAEIVVAWDHGRAAARAVGDAMPLLRIAERVRVVTVDEPAKSEIGKAVERLVRHLRAHGIHATFEAIESTWRPTGERLMEHAKACAADLLVLGAFGHSRARDFVLGSATRSVLADPLLPVFLSH